MASTSLVSLREASSGEGGTVSWARYHGHGIMGTKLWESVVPIWGLVGGG